MADSRSSRSARLGALAEKAARDRYGLEADHSSWHDARDPEGKPVEVKATMTRQRDGTTGRFRIFRRYHRTLEEAGGRYVFVVYRPRGRGIEVVRTRSVNASDLSLSWGGSGGHRGSLEAKIPHSSVFG
jgi:hypothetical protein